MKNERLDLARLCPDSACLRPLARRPYSWGQATVGAVRYRRQGRLHLTCGARRAPPISWADESLPRRRATEVGNALSTLQDCS